jgi:hypothetical protein
MPNTIPVGALPAPVAAYIRASNAADADGYLATFADDALVNDDRREFWGKQAIGRWAARELFDASVTMEPVEAVELHGAYIVTARIDGTYDKTSLPDPLLLTFHFVLAGDAIAQLVIIHNKPAGEHP